MNSSPHDPGARSATTVGSPAQAVASPGVPSSLGVSGAAPDRRYLLDNARAEAGERFVALAELFDGVTRGHCDRLGVGPGWRCWEVGAGGRSIPEALTAAVGPTGYVLATDINPAWLDPHGTYEVRSSAPTGCALVRFFALLPPVVAQRFLLLSGDYVSASEVRR